MIASRFDNTLTGIHDFGNESAVRGADLREWSFTYTIDGLPDVYAGQILNRLPGDANGDGCVDDLDSAVLEEQWQQSTNLWEQADFDGNGIVNDLDLTALAVNWQQGCGGSFAKALAEQDIIPGPATMTLLAIGGLSLIVRRRR